MNLDDDVFREEELRYWSLCHYEFYSQKLSRCLHDEQIPINEDGFYTIVTSKPEDRPSKVRAHLYYQYGLRGDCADGCGIDAAFRAVEEQTKNAL